MVSVRDWFGARTAIGVVFLAAVLSTGIGLVNISAPTVGGILGPYIPESVRLLAGFTGALTGFLLLANSFGLRRRLRWAWYLALILLPVSALQGLIQGSAGAIPLVGLSVIGLGLLVLNHDVFERPVDLSVTQLSALLAIVGSLSYATAGSYALREQFNGIETPFDALYFALVTGSTVGYGDITPDTVIAKLFGLSALLITVASFAVALGVLLTPAIEARLTKALGRMTDTQLDILENHILILGHGELTEPILDELENRASVLIITPDTSRAQRLTERGFDVLTADPSGEESLERARVKTARAVIVATNNDAEDALAILTARQLNPDVHIVAAATHRENENKLRRAGANTVISPAALGGHFLAESAIGGSGLEGLEAKLLDEEPEKVMEQTDVDPEESAEDGALDD